jgi:hypothetical protein
MSNRRPLNRHEFFRIIESSELQSGSNAKHKAETA